MLPTQLWRQARKHRSQHREYCRDGGAQVLGMMWAWESQRRELSADSYSLWSGTPARQGHVKDTHVGHRSCTLCSQSMCRLITPPCCWSCCFLPRCNAIKCRAMRGSCCPQEGWGGSTRDAGISLWHLLCAIASASHEAERVVLPCPSPTTSPPERKKKG